MATVGGCAGFAAICGTGPVSVAAMGTVALPEMRRYNYDPRLATGSIVGGSTIGGMIPPSILFIIYAILVEQSIGRLFNAGIFPGISAAIFYMIAICILCKRNPLMGPRGERANFIQRLFSLKGIWSVLALFILVMGGLYMGVFTPTEAAGVGAFGAFLVTLARRRLNWQVFRDSLVDAGRTTAMIFLLFIGVMLFSHFIAITRLPSDLAGFIAELAVNRYIILGAILLVFLVFGCIMGGLATIMLTVPVFFPAIAALGFDPIWFGVLVVKMGEQGALTPPMGLSLFVMKGVAKDIPISTIFRGIIPFVITDVFHIALLVAIPQISLFLPSLMK